MIPEALTPYALLAIGALWGYIIGRQTAGGDQTGAVDRFLDEQRERLNREYERDDRLTIDEYERRLSFLLEPDTARIMRDARKVDGVGIKSAFAVAREFDGDFDAYRSASEAELRRANGVGENRARAIAKRYESAAAESE